MLHPTSNVLSFPNLLWFFDNSYDITMDNLNVYDMARLAPYPQGLHTAGKCASYQFTTTTTTASTKQCYPSRHAPRLHRPSICRMHGAAIHWPMQCEDKRAIPSSATITAGAGRIGARWCEGLRKDTCGSFRNGSRSRMLLLFSKLALETTKSTAQSLHISSLCSHSSLQP